MRDKTAWLLTVLLLALVGCSAAPPTYRELDAPGASFSQVWMGMQHVTRRLGYAADGNVTDRGKRVFQSSWHTLPRFPRGTIRHRMRAEVVRIAPGEPGWRIRYYVEQQTVDSITRSLSPREEDWEAAGQDGLKERVFIGTLRAELGLKVLTPTTEPTDQEPTRNR